MHLVYWSFCMVLLSEKDIKVVSEDKVILFNYLFESDVNLHVFNIHIDC